MSAEPFDWKTPDYTAVYAERAARLTRIRENPDSLLPLRVYYAEHPAEFINDWGVTSDPRARNRGAPTEMPFLLFARQREMLEFTLERMRNREPGIIEKSRDCGASWAHMCLAVTLCLFGRGVVVGVGSNKEDRVDRTGDPDSLLWKARFFLKNLPPEFRGGWDETKHSAHMRIQFPETGSAIVGEAGDAIGRGGRSTLFMVDEAAFIERPQLIEASLASNTDCRIDISTPNGRANSFATKRWSGRIPVFTFRWTDDHRKGPEWYERQKMLLDPVTLAAEVDLNYDASTEGQLLPIEWIYSAVDAHKKLGIEPTGERRGALDVADEGKDRNAFAQRHGILLENLRIWSGKGSNIYATTVKAFALCEEFGCGGFDYDADGLGAGVRGDAVDINTKRRETGKHEITAEPFRGSGAVFEPDGSLVEGRLNRDYFGNQKAQSWWNLRLRFQATHRAVADGLAYDPDQIISLDSTLEELNALIGELVQPTYSVNSVGKIIIDKTPEGAMSPNRADSVMISYSPFRSGAYFSSVPAAVQIPNAPTVTAYTMPKVRMDLCYAVIQFLGDVAGVVYCASPLSDNDGTLTKAAGGFFFVLDWDLRVLDATAEAWLWDVEARLKELHQTVCAFNNPNAMPIPPTIFCDDLDEGYAQVLTQRGLPVIPTADKDENFPPVSERLTLARPYVTLGHVTFTPIAAQRTRSFRGVSRNFLREVLDQANVPESNALAIALATAVLFTFKNAPLPPRLKPEAPPAKLVPPPMPTILLKPGRHTIDGAIVDVPADGDKDLVEYPLAPGRYVVDSKITYVYPPGGGIRIRSFSPE